jgi:hypothetical protein
MSYDQIVDDKVVKFREEEDYLDCRLQYLQYCRDAVMPEVTFIQYIQNGMYPTRITVENIVSIVSNWLGTESSFAVGNDSQAATYNTEYVGDWTAGGYNPAPYSSVDLSQPVPAPALTTFEIDEAFGSGLFSNDVAFGEFGTGQMQAMQAGGLPPIEDKKEEPSNPIEHRWDILDLRGDDNEHD